MFAILAAVFFWAAPSPRHQVPMRLYAGTVADVQTHLMLFDDGGNASGASYYLIPGSAAENVYLVTGSRKDGTYNLREIRRGGREPVSITARINGRGLVGSWAGRPFVMKPIQRNESLLTSSTLILDPVIDRIYRAMIDADSHAVELETRLACTIARTIHPDVCIVEERIKRIRLQKPTAAQHRKRCLEEADRLSCHFAVAAFPMDRELASAACRVHRIRCDFVWGADSVSLSDAASRGDVHTVRELLACGANPNAGGGALPMPLQAAVRAESAPIVRLLLEAGADPNHPAQESGGIGMGSILAYALANGMDDIAMLLADHGARVGEHNDALISAVSGRHHDLVRRILENGEHPDLSAFAGSSALMSAVENNDMEMVELLLAYGADPDLHLKYSDGSAIDQAEERGQTEILELLLDARARLASAPGLEEGSPALKRVFDDLKCGMSMDDVTRLARESGAAQVRIKRQMIEISDRRNRVQASFRDGKVDGMAFISPIEPAQFLYCTEH